MDLLGQLDVAVAGISALGAPMVEMLARSRVRSITMCDSDIIDMTNLNRLPATSLQDVGVSKAVFYHSYLKRIAPEVQVKAFPCSLYEDKVQSAFAQADVIFGCLDSGARHSLNRIATKNLIPYFDLGAGIKMEEGIGSFIGGQVYSILPGAEVCLDCAGVFDTFKAEFWSEEKKERENAQGYLPDLDIESPLVMHLDYSLVGVGFQAMLDYVWGLRKDMPFKRYLNLASSQMETLDVASEGCIYCKENQLSGGGDKVQNLIPEA